MRHFNFHNWHEGEVTPFPRFVYDLSLCEDHKKHHGKRLYVFFAYVVKRPEYGEAWRFWKHYRGVNFTFAWLINFSIYK